MQVKICKFVAYTWFDHQCLVSIFNISSEKQEILVQLFDNIGKVGFHYKKI